MSFKMVLSRAKASTSFKMGSKLPTTYIMHGYEQINIIEVMTFK